MNKFLYPIILFLTCSCGSTDYIHYAVMQNDLTGVKSYVDSGEIDTRDGNGATPLIVAAYYGHDSIVKYLCDRGAKVDHRDYNGWTALMYASYYNFYNVAKILIDHNAAVDIVDSEGHTALYYAQEYQHDKIASLLKGNEKKLQIKKRAKSSTVKPGKKKIEKQSSAASLKPSIEILGIEIIPSPVRAGSTFKLEVEYKVNDPAIQDEKIPVQFSFAILSGTKVLFKLNPTELKSENGIRFKKDYSLNAYEEKGNYTIKVFLKYKGETTEDSKDFKIE